MRLIFSILIFLYISLAYADNLSIMLYINDVSAGDELYSKYTEKLGFLRKLKGNSRHNYEYHITLAMLENIPAYEKEKFKKYIVENFKIHENQEFIFGVTSLLGTGVPVIVAIPENATDFTNLNNELYKLTVNYNSKLKFTKNTSPENYIPHLTLNAKLHRQVKINNLGATLKSLNNELEGYRILVSKLAIND